ncbi:sigma-w pathway protein ysdB [Metabacillus arenae]|uniref:Sigma-w pathway protein ysdB n=1 Tax=Metabacillus arenae TaxID=2771434 RepID=A0A926NAZ1_9BACI|nr:sigma-w pathway protein ysdB [Metabacillus arenae]MBD1380069.1 sigma-w pathway protein ysdB [Metabacillus arenae]
MVLLLRLLIVALFIFLVYSLVKYLLNPKRKLELACEQKNYYLLDDKENVRKNFFLTFKGVLFEGEKYLGREENSFEVVSIFIGTNTPNKLQGLSLSDFQFIEESIKQHYPHSKIDWKSPIKEFLTKKK